MPCHFGRPQGVPTGSQRLVISPAGAALKRATTDQAILCPDCASQASAHLGSPLGLVARLLALACVLASLLCSTWVVATLLNIFSPLKASVSHEVSLHQEAGQLLHWAIKAMARRGHSPGHLHALLAHVLATGQGGKEEAAQRTLSMSHVARAVSVTVASRLGSRSSRGATNPQQRVLLQYQALLRQAEALQDSGLAPQGTAPSSAVESTRAGRQPSTNRPGDSAVPSSLDASGSLTQRVESAIGLPVPPTAPMLQLLHRAAAAQTKETLLVKRAHSRVFPEAAGMPQPASGLDTPSGAQHSSRSFGIGSAADDASGSRPRGSSASLYLASSPRRNARLVLEQGMLPNAGPGGSGRPSITSLAGASAPAGVCDSPVASKQPVAVAWEAQAQPEEQAGNEEGKKDKVVEENDSSNLGPQARWAHRKEAQVSRSASGLRGGVGQLPPRQSASGTPLPSESAASGPAARKHALPKRAATTSLLIKPANLKAAPAAAPPPRVSAPGTRADAEQDPSTLAEAWAQVLAQQSASGQPRSRAMSRLSTPGQASPAGSGIANHSAPGAGAGAPPARLHGLLRDALKMSIRAQSLRRDAGSGREQGSGSATLEAGSVQLARASAATSDGAPLPATLADAWSNVLARQGSSRAAQGQASPAMSVASGQASPVPGRAAPVGSNAGPSLPGPPPGKQLHGLLRDTLQASIRSKSQRQGASSGGSLGAGTCSGLGSLEAAWPLPISAPDVVLREPTPVALSWAWSQSMCHQGIPADSSMSLDGQNAQEGPGTSDRLHGLLKGTLQTSIRAQNSRLGLAAGSAHGSGGSGKGLGLGLGLPSRRPSSRAQLELHATSISNPTNAFTGRLKVYLNAKQPKLVQTVAHDGAAAQEGSEADERGDTAAPEAGPRKLGRWETIAHPPQEAAVPSVQLQAEEGAPDVHEPMPGPRAMQASSAVLPMADVLMHSTNEQEAGVAGVASSSAGGDIAGSSGNGTGMGGGPLKAHRRSVTWGVYEVFTTDTTQPGTMGRPGPAPGAAPTGPQVPFPSMPSLPASAQSLLVRGQQIPDPRAGYEAPSLGLAPAARSVLKRSTWDHATTAPLSQQQQDLLLRPVGHPRQSFSAGQLGGLQTSVGQPLLGTGARADGKWSRSSSRHRKSNKQQPQPVDGLDAALRQLLASGATLNSSDVSLLASAVLQMQAEAAGGAGPSSSRPASARATARTPAAPSELTPLAPVSSHQLDILLSSYQSSAKGPGSRSQWQLSGSQLPNFMPLLSSGFEASRDAAAPQVGRTTASGMPAILESMTSEQLFISSSANAQDGPMPGQGPSKRHGSSSHQILTLTTTLSDVFEAAAMAAAAEAAAAGGMGGPGISPRQQRGLPHLREIHGAASRRLDESPAARPASKDSQLPAAPTAALAVVREMISSTQHLQRELQVRAGAGCLGMAGYARIGYDSLPSGCVSPLRLCAMLPCCAPPLPETAAPTHHAPTGPDRGE